MLGKSVYCTWGMELSWRGSVAVAVGVAVAVAVAVTVTVAVIFFFVLVLMYVKILAVSKLQTFYLKKLCFARS